MAINLAVKILGQIDGLLTSLKKAEKELNSFSRKVTRVGEELTKSLTLPIAGLGYLAVKNFAEAEKAAASLRMAIKANGKDVTSTMTKYTQFADEIQRLTTYEDDAVLGFMQLAESMQAPDVAKAVKDAIGLNAAYGIEMPSAMKMAVAAQQGLYTMMGRTIPAIRALKSDTEKAALANKIFADGFQIATEQAKVGLGPLEQLKNTLGNLSESFGKIIVEAITPFVRGLKSLAEWLNSLTESQRKWVVGIGLTLAAIGPLFLVIGKIPAVLASCIAGFSTLTGVLKGLIIFTAANPWLALAGAIAIVTTTLITYFNIKNSGGEYDTLVKKEQNEAKRKKQLIDEYVQSDKEGRKKILDGWRETAKKYIQQWEEAKKVGDKKAMEHYAYQVALINVLAADMKDAAVNATNAGVTGFQNLADEIKNLNEELKETKDDLVSVSMEIVKMTPKTITSILPAQTGLTPDAGITKPGTIQQPGALDIDLADKTATKWITAFDSIANALGGIWGRFKDVFSSITNLVTEAADGFAKGWKNAIGLVREVASSVMSIIGDIISSNFQQRRVEMEDYYDAQRDRIQGSVMTEDQKNKALSKLDKDMEKKRKALAREQAKDQKAVAIIQAIINTALAITAALAVPYIGTVLAIIVGALGAAQIALIASQPLPALAAGGLAYAPSLAMVGDNPNARLDPEVIAPLSKLKAMGIGGGQVEVYGVLRGEDLLISTERANEQRIRTRGF